MKATKIVIGAVLAVMLCAADGRAQGAAATAVLNPNTAIEKELLSLPNLTPALVKSLISGRPHKGMVAVDGLLTPALTEPQRKELYVRLFIPINLNTSPREEIAMVPGIGTRMIREFLEYRPYANIEQFRKEIGKYVDQAEVARFEKYVTLK
jgi:DNA uptake protein ComE-like DNA-binding protein